MLLSFGKDTNNWLTGCRAFHATHPPQLVAELFILAAFHEGTEALLYFPAHDGRFFQSSELCSEGLQRRFGSTFSGIVIRHDWASLPFYGYVGPSAEDLFGEEGRLMGGVDFVG
jgi:hypothetical protein